MQASPPGSGVQPKKDPHMDTSSTQPPEAPPSAVSVADSAAVPETAAVAAQIPASRPPETASSGSQCNAWCWIGVAVLVLAVLAAVAAILRRRRPAADATSPEKGSGDCVEIYVGNLNYATTDEQLRKEFARYGVVKSARVIGHRASGKSKGYGFVEMPHRNEAEIAISKLNNHEVMGRKLRVNEARNGIPGTSRKKK